MLKALGYFLLAALIPLSLAVPRLRLGAGLIALFATISISGKAVEWLWLRILGSGTAHRLKHPRAVAVSVLAVLFLLAGAGSVMAAGLADGRLVLLLMLLTLAFGSVLSTMGAWLYLGWDHLCNALAFQGGE